MLIATDIRVGNMIKVDGKLCKVISYEMRGTGKFGKTVNLKLKSVEDAHTLEKSYRAEEKVENVEVHFTKVQYLYKDGDNFVFMNQENFEQFSLPAKTIGKQALFLKENDEFDVTFDGERPVSVNFPKSVDLKVTMAPPGVKGGQDSTYKEAELENGLKILVPQFVNEGETVRVNVEDLSYMERLTVKSMKSDAVPGNKKEKTKE